MPSTTDRPDGSEDPFAVAEALQSVVRDTEDLVIERDTAAEDGPDAAGRRDTVVVDDELLGRRDTVRLPHPRRPEEPARRAPMIVAVAFATLWAALLSYLPVAVVIGLARTMEGAGGLGDAARAGLAGWLLGHGLPIGTSIGPLAVTPLLLTLLVIWRLNRAGLHVTRAVGARRSGSAARALGVAGALALAYALVGALTAVLADGRGTQISAGRAALHFFAFGLAGALIGSLRGTGALATLARRSPPVLRHGARAGLVAAFLILGAGAVAGGLSVALGAGQAAEMIAAYRTGVAGQAGITVISIGYAVNASIWAAAYLLGPGFALGTGSTVSLTEVSVGPLPMLPLAAGLPAGPMGATGAALLLLPVIAGGAAGWLLTQRLRHPGREAGRDAGRRTARRGAPGPDGPPWPLLIGASLLAGPVAGCTLSLFAWLSGGSMGAGRLAEIGPDPLLVGLVGAAVAAVSVLAGAAVARVFGPQRPPAPGRRP
ncbi:DUF6350 family protein [Actinoplanes sp. DH11]|uniref:cell division protein PerM n=1 Tax=Actinoplanes sp. DH11 TaxID=2857011 RepID=UPI001E32E59C|nr:DUF6350 family protein [Actinoplanes sp. DH11]